MSLVKRNNTRHPFFINEFFTPDWFGGISNDSNKEPSVNIKENDKDFTLELSIPGRTKEDFKIEVDNDVLTVSAESKLEANEEKGSYTRKEFSYASFKRAFTLSEMIELNKIDAEYKDGILKFTLPKKEEALPKPKRVIDIA
ncbi:MAG: molecular chaperone Hsp20 [Flavobacteriaceae bacterium]|nr:MAG: molecular chaperone Hsp20 [Flavobacteriaceae bacterium]